jgi:tetratricopeptide (TPR) repeat protein
VSQHQEIKFKYREEFRSAHSEAFQHWFQKLAVALHGDDCFLAIRVTRGDGGLDGLVLKEGRVYQLYAPPSLGTDGSTATKVKTDFEKARQTLGAALKTWTFLHNSSDGKVGHLTATALTEITDENPTVCIEAIGIDGLWERLEKLPSDKLASLFGTSKPSRQAESEIRVLLKQANELANQDNRRRAFEMMEQALAIAESEKIVNLQAEVLVGLCLMSSSRDSIGDRKHYFQRVQALQDSISEPQVLVMFHRARAAYFEEERATQDAEGAFLAAIALASSASNSERCAEQLCVARSEYVHLLCNANRALEAKTHLELAETYARQNSEIRNGEVFQAAINAGVHWAAKVGDEDAASERIRALEFSANTTYLASRIAGQLINAANNLSHIDCHRAALNASEAALRLADKMSVDTRQTFVPGALYTLAMAHFHAGHLEEALAKASSLVNMTATAETAAIRFGAAQLVSIISRHIGDLGMAVRHGELALGLAPEVDSSFMAKMNLAEALADSGQTERALREAQEAYQLVHGRASIPLNVQAEILGHIAEYSAQLGENKVLDNAMSYVNALPAGDEKLALLKERISKRVEANSEIRKRILDISLIDQDVSVIKEALLRVNTFHQFIGNSQGEFRTDEHPVSTLHEANALTIAPLIQWWEDTADDYNAAALDYDYWGRGCFAQILQNLRAFPHSLNVAFEVRAVEDIRQALRLWSLYSDFILLLWKGPTKSGRFLHLIDGEWFGPWGAGYMLALGTKLESKKGRVRFPAVGYASWLPDEVSRFLLTEAKSFLASGRMLLVPASGVGCVSPGHGVMEQLLTEAANCIPAIQGEQGSNLEIGLLPYSADIPLDILFDFVNETKDDLLHMRKLVFAKAAHIKTNGLQPHSKALEIEIADTLRRLRHQNTDIVTKRNLSPANQEAQLGVAPFHISGHGLISGADAGFAPLLALESMGYGWRIGASAQSRTPYRYEPAEGEAIGAWLAPPKCGAQFLAVQAEN